MPAARTSGGLRRLVLALMRPVSIAMDMKTPVGIMNCGLSARIMRLRAVLDYLSFRINCHNGNTTPWGVLARDGDQSVSLAIRSPLTRGCNLPRIDMVPLGWRFLWQLHAASKHVRT